MAIYCQLGKPSWRKSGSHVIWPLWRPISPFSLLSDFISAKTKTNKKKYYYHAKVWRHSLMTKAAINWEIGRGLFAITERYIYFTSWGWIINRTGGRTMLYLTRSTLSNVDIARHGISPAKDLGLWELCYKLFQPLRRNFHIFRHSNVLLFQRTLLRTIEP